MVATQSQRVSAGTLAQALAADCEGLFSELIGDAHYEGGELRGHMPDGGVVSMAYRGRKRGRWCAWASDRQSGDCLDLVRFVLFAGDASAAYRWALQRVGMAQQAKPRALPAAQPKARPPGLNERGRRLYDAASSEAGPIDAYLRGRFGASLYTVRAHGVLRFHPRVFHSHDAGHFPAMVAPIVYPATDVFMAVHVTYLQASGHGWRKAPVDPAKKVFGSYRGGVIALADGPDTDTWLIGEGIENTLAAWWCEERRACARAAVAINNLVAIGLPDHVRSVVLVCDNDEARDAIDALRSEAMERWRDEGRAVEWIRPPLGTKDFTDLMQRELRFRPERVGHE